MTNNKYIKIISLRHLTPIFKKSGLFIISLFWIVTLSSQNLHVTVDGSDVTGDGSLSNPFATMTEASNHVQPGDTVFVHEGTYHNENFGDGDIWKIEKLAEIQCNGTPDAWIVFMPWPGDTVLLEFDGSNGVLIKYSSYVKFMGFDIKGMGDVITLEEVQAAWGLYKDSVGIIHDLAVEMGIDITDPNLLGQKLDKPPTPNIKKPDYFNGVGLMSRVAHHIIFENNTIRWSPASGLRANKSDYITFINNEVYYNTYRTSAGVGALTVAEATVMPEGDTYNGIKFNIINNNVHDNENQIYSWAPSKSFIHFVIDEGSGIFLTRNNETYDYGYIYIANNLSWKNGASGIVVHKTNRAIVENNTVYDNGTTNGDDAKPGGIGFNTVDDVIFRNNISWSKPYKFALGKVGGPNTNLVFDSNLVFNNYGSESVVKEVPDGWFEANPLFNDVTDFDFRLTAASPAIDMGDPAALVTDDYAGHPRNDGKPDIGAYEYDSILTVPEDYDKGMGMLEIYPNPAKKNIRIKLSSDQDESINIVDMKSVTQDFNYSRTNSKEVIVDISNLSPGIFLLTTSSGFGRFVKLRR